MSITALKLSMGDKIGIICPSHVPDPARHKRSIAVLESLGFKVKSGKLYTEPTVTPQAWRTASDFNSMVADNSIRWCYSARRGRG